MDRNKLWKLGRVLNQERKYNSQISVKQKEDILIEKQAANALMERFFTSKPY